MRRVSIRSEAKALGGVKAGFVRHPLLYQINTRAFLNAVAGLGQATLDDFPDAEIDAIADHGFEWIWLLSIWQLGAAGRNVALSNPAWRSGYLAALPDLRDDDVESSGFAIVEYSVARELGGPHALARLRSRFAGRGLKLMLDFVPNHMAVDSMWTHDHPDYFIAGTQGAMAKQPQNYETVATGRGQLLLAHGRDPNFDGWPDTLQLDYTNPALQQAQRSNLLDIAEQCDGVRCDMAMLLLPEIFERTWGVRPQAFWPDAIAFVKRERPGFTFMAEAYWDLELVLQDQGFDYAYDKRLYDRLVEGDAAAVRDHLALAPVSYQNKLARFLENHDEPRAAATFSPARLEAAAVITFLAPGLRFINHGQLDGARVRLPTPLVREPIEASDPLLRGFYDRLLDVLSVPTLHEGEWQAVAPSQAWDNNPTHDRFVAFSWRAASPERSPRGNVLVVVNYSDVQSQCRLRVPFADLAGRRVSLSDLLGSERYERDGTEIENAGLFVDLAPWGYNAFALHLDDKD